ncbi:MAG TPA: GNAT family N-acetyltransferase [Gemmatimonadaceae bacterium]|nr:GNAT family N-acetyltransferase [Gemmatimonadaceae bacterium]
MSEITDSSFRIRRAIESDASALLALMRGLAHFEGYATDFAVDEATLVRQGFSRQPPDFYALVAESTKTPGLLGMLVYYLIPFTFRARPTLYIKELYVAESGRGLGTGRALMRAAAAAAIEHDCATIKWHVAEWNADARRFYERLGAEAAHEWVEYALSEASLRALAERPSVADRV